MESLYCEIYFDAFEIALVVWILLWGVNGSVDMKLFRNYSVGFEGFMLKYILRKKSVVCFWCMKSY